MATRRRSSQTAAAMDRARGRRDDAPAVHQAATIYVTTVVRRRDSTYAVDRVHEELRTDGGLTARRPRAKPVDHAMLERIDALEAAVYGGGGQRTANANDTPTDTYGTAELISLMADTEAALSEADRRVRRLVTIGECVMPALAALERDMDSCVRSMQQSRAAMERRCSDDVGNSAETTSQSMRFVGTPDVDDCVAQAQAQRRTGATAAAALLPRSASDQDPEDVANAMHHPALVASATDYENALDRVYWARNATADMRRPAVEPPPA